jgi:alkylation response protein AidB-like acyl-CoA dehydrogenase
MELGDSPFEAAFRAKVRAFLSAHAPTRPLDFTNDKVVLGPAKAWQRTLHSHGYAALTWPVEYGGQGKGRVERFILNQELGRHGIRGGPFMVGIDLAGPTLIAHGTPEQKARYLMPMLSGDEIWCQLFSEPGAGSDLASLSTRAVRQGDDWVVSGQKVWTSFAHLADFGLLLARTDPNAKRHRGISYFVLPMRDQGVTVRPLRQMTGHCHFSEVFLQEVRIPNQLMIGGAENGWTVALTTLLNERLAIGSIDPMASFRPLFEQARAHPERVDPLLKDGLMRLYTSVRCLELLGARAMTELSRADLPGPLDAGGTAAFGSLMKLLIARIRTQEAELGLRLLGSEALLREGSFQDKFLQAPSLHIAGGTDQIQKNILAERVLGLPREQK